MHRVAKASPADMLQSGLRTASPDVKQFTDKFADGVQAASVLTQPASFQMVRMSVVALALAALVLGIVAVLSAPPRPQMSPLLTADRAPAGQTHAARQAPLSITTASCGSGAYVSGDMVGDASPSSVYAAMCGSSPR
jgi:hypothetical protein